MVVLFAILNYLSELVHKLKPAYLYSLLRYFTYMQSGSVLGSVVSVKPRQNFDYRDRILTPSSAYPYIKKRIYRDKIQGPSSNYRDRNLAYVEPCRQYGYQNVFVWLMS